MKTAPTAAGRTHLNTVVDVIVEQETGPAITQGSLAPKSPCRITVLTDRTTGAEIRLDDQMIAFIMSTIGYEPEQIHY